MKVPGKNTQDGGSARHDMTNHCNGADGSIAESPMCNKESRGRKMGTFDGVHIHGSVLLGRMTHTNWIGEMEL